MRMRISAARMIEPRPLRDGPFLCRAGDLEGERGSSSIRGTAIMLRGTAIVNGDRRAAAFR